MANVRPLIHDPVFLSGKSLPPTPEDLDAALDLKQTLLFHREECAGMAANMIGVRKRILAFFSGTEVVLLFDPQILSGTGTYAATETCLSYLGAPKTVTRYRKIRVRYRNEAFAQRVKTFEGFEAQVIQHEIDHMDGILI